MGKRKKRNIDPNVRLQALGLKSEDLIGKSKEEQIRIVKKAYHKKAKDTHPDATKKDTTSSMQKVNDIKDDLTNLIEQGYFPEEQQVKTKNEDNDIVDEAFIDSLNKAVKEKREVEEKRKMEELLHEYEEEYEERKNRVSKMTEEFNKPDFSIKTAIQYCKNKIRTFIRKISSFHNEDGQER